MDKVCEACKTIPPIVAEGYQEKGSYETISGVNCYVAAPQPTPKSGIIFIYDIFGYYKQTLQGADILALTEPGHVVVMPDFFFGKPMDINNFPPDTPEKKQLLGSFFQNEADIPMATKTATTVLNGLKEKYPTVEKWGIFGLCWGGKAATLISNSTKAFAASGQAHPAMLDPQDIASSPIPHLCLSSKDEDKEAASKVIDILKDRTDGSYSTIYSENIHGWLGARANLKNDLERESYEKGYKDVIEFFKKTLA